MTGHSASRNAWRGDAGAGKLADLEVEARQGEVVLDVLHRLQVTQAADLAIQWNCKAASAVPARRRSTGGPGCTDNALIPMEAAGHPGPGLRGTVPGKGTDLLLPPLHQQARRPTARA